MFNITDTSQTTYNLAHNPSVQKNQTQNKSNSVINNTLITSIGHISSQYILPSTVATSHDVILHHNVTMNYNHDNNISNTEKYKDTMNTENGSRREDNNTQIVQLPNATYVGFPYFISTFLQDAKDTFL